MQFFFFGCWPIWCWTRLLLFRKHHLFCCRFLSIINTKRRASAIRILPFKIVDCVYIWMGKWSRWTFCHHQFLKRKTDETNVKSWTKWKYKREDDLYKHHHHKRDTFHWENIYNNVIIDHHPGLFFFVKDANTLSRLLKWRYLTPK